MRQYTPLPLPNSHRIEGYGLFGPVVDGLLIARGIITERLISDFDDEAFLLKEIDRRIQEAKVAYARQAK